MDGSSSTKGSPSPPTYLANHPSFSTRAIHAGFEPARWGSRALVTPITLSTNFKLEDPNEKAEFIYGRLNNPTRSAVERSLASLEEAEYAVTFGSGTAAIAGVVQLLQSGDHLLASQHLYSGTWTYFTQIAQRQGIQVEFLDCRDLSNLKAALKPNTRMVLVETPTNPTLDLVDLTLLCSIVRQHNSEMLPQAKDQAGPAFPSVLTKRSDKVLVAVDNTFLTPFFQRPLSFGVDLVIHSCTKYLNGSTDVIMGVVCTNCSLLREKLVFLQTSAGAIPSPFDCYLLQRSLRTLPIRMQRHMDNGLAVARFLQAHPHVRQVNHPGLPSHPQHKLALAQSYGHSGMVSFYLAEDCLERSRRFLQALSTVTLSTSLGGIESLAELPLLMSHGTVPREENELAGVTAGLVRLSVGLEDVQDLTRDLDQALNRAFN